MKQLKSQSLKTAKSLKAGTSKFKKTRTGQVAPPATRPTWEFEYSAWSHGLFPVAGVDEAGRGPLAGPVVAAAVILPEGFAHPHLNDSKQVKPETRAELAEFLRNTPGIEIGVGIATVDEIDSINILRATFLAMRRAVHALGVHPAALLIDGNQRPGGGLPQITIVEGDARSLSIAAASIIAKEWRDAHMRTLHETHPHYGFAQHKGYGTAAHRTAIKQHGPCLEHRRSFLSGLLEETGLLFGDE
ncbi:MAG TPA: ribonuclease HII [Candidatus Methylacidiphilales bacterium]|nr:ribonuclease HII [Candidatus Methylacidiphilales bacterium]